MIVNITQHNATPEQKNEGVVEPENKERVKYLLTFEDVPNKYELQQVARKLAEIASNSGAKRAMIGGAPYLMAHLEVALRAAEIEPLYAFSRRESVEQAQEDGSVRKINVFKHVGWVSAG